MSVNIPTRSTLVLGASLVASLAGLAAAPNGGDGKPEQSTTQATPASGERSDLEERKRQALRQRDGGLQNGTAARPTTTAGRPGGAPAAHATVGLDPELLRRANESQDAVFDASTASHDFGDIFDDEPQVAQIDITNTGTTELILLDAKGSCGCTVAALTEENRVVPAGETRVIEVNYRPQGRRGQQRQTVRLTTNDRTEPQREIEIHALVKPRLMLSPQMINFGRIVRGESASLDLAVAGWDSSFESSRGSAEDPSIMNVERVGVTKDRVFDLNPSEDGVGEFKLDATVYRVELLPTEELGRKTSNVLLRTNMPGNTIVRVPVLVEVVSPIEAVPRFPTLGMITAGDEVSQTFRLRHAAGKTFKVVSSEVKDPALQMSVDVKPVDAMFPTEYEVTIHGKAPEQGSILRGAVQFTVEGEQGQETIEVPFSGRIRPRQG